LFELSGADWLLAFVDDTGFGSDVGKCSVAVVVIKDCAAVAGDVQIGIAVIVVVADGDSLTVVALTADAGFFRHVGKRSVTIVVVKRRAQRMRRFVNVGGGRLYKV